MKGDARKIKHEKLMRKKIVISEFDINIKIKKYSKIFKKKFCRVMQSNGMIHAT